MDATSEPSEQNTDTSSATEDDNAQQTITDAVAGATADDTNASAKQESDDKLGDSGKRALSNERRARRDAEKQLSDMRTQLQQYEDRDKTELQKARERAESFERDLTQTRVANARLMSAAVHNIPPDLIDLLGNGTEEEIDARAKLLAEKFAAATPPPAPVVEPAKPAPAARRPVESLTPGAKPASEQPEDPNEWLRRMAGRTP